MLATGLLILKIIGLILLGILAFILALVLIVLLIPIRYQAEASYYHEAKVKAKVNWLLRIVSCKAVYDGEWDMEIRILGFRIGKSVEEAQEDGEPVLPSAGSADPDSGGSHAGISSEKMRKASEEIQNARETEAAEAAPERQKKLETEILKELEEKRAGQDQKKDAASDAKKKRKLRFKMPFSFWEICDKLKQAGEQKDRAAEFLKKEENQRTFSLLIRQLRALLKHILPVRMRGKMHFGFDDPYTTGQVLMYISPFYGMYGKRFQIIPVFEEPVLEGEAWLRGRIRIGTVLVLGIRMLFDKNFRTLLRKWRK